MSELINPQASPQPQLPESYQAVDQSWLKKHRTGLGLAGFAVAGAISLTHSDGVVSDLEHTAAWATPAVVTTEAIAWTGGGLMILAAGKKIGNPLTLKPRLQKVANDLVDNKNYQRGWKIAAVGATGTASVIAGGAITSLPKESWPLAFTVAGASLAFSSLSLPHKRAQTEETK